MAEERQEEIHANQKPDDKSINSNEDPSTINYQPSTKEMEVHHHPQLAHKPKPWKEYFLEFLMIFLAVTMGFFAESLREHIGDKSKEREYMSSLVEELKYDTAEYNTVIKKIYYLRPLLDSLFMNVQEARRFNFILQGKWNTPVNETRIGYVPTLQTIQQLKNSGNLRLIRDKLIVNKMLEYATFAQDRMQSEAIATEAAVEKIFAKEDDMCNEAEFNKKTDQNMQDHAAQYNMENGSFYDMPLIVKDPVRLNEFANSFINYKSRNWGHFTIINQAKKTASDLIKLINNEYHFDNE
jgi:hypothetical protein